MKKHYIIDGYNVLHASPDLKRNSEAFGMERARADLLSAVREFAQRRGAFCTLVYDGVVNENDSRGLVRVVSTRRRSADDVIREQARTHGRNLIVVTSDLEIIGTAKVNLATVMGAAEFAAELDLAPAPERSAPDRRGLSPTRLAELRSPTEKPGNVSDDEMDEWKRLFGA